MLTPRKLMARNTQGGISPSLVPTGYFVGGHDGSYLYEIEALTFSAETIRTLSARCSPQRRSHVGFSSLAVGYAAGGYRGMTWAEVDIDALTFSSETDYNVTSNLSDYKQVAGKANSSTKGYACAGTRKTDYNDDVSAIDNFHFATETAASIGAALSVAKYNLAGVSSSVGGILAGGNTSGPVFTNVAEKFTFATEAVSSIVDTLATARRHLRGVNSAVKGYFVGGLGSGTTTYDEIDGFLFATFGALNPAAALSTDVSAPGACNSSTKGYFAGGWNGGAFADVATIQSFDFGSESTAVLGAATGTTRADQAGYQSGGAV